MSYDYDSTILKVGKTAAAWVANRPTEVWLRSAAEMRTKAPGLLVLVWALISSAYGQRAEIQRSISVAVIAPSVSTSMEARRIIARQNWTQGKFKTSDAILVVVRSSLSLPLQSSYAFVGELKEDADRQLNIAGPKYHVYLYQLGDDLECTELKHISYEAER